MPDQQRLLPDRERLPRDRGHPILQVVLRRLPQQQPAAIANYRVVVAVETFLVAPDGGQLAPGVVTDFANSIQQVVVGFGQVERYEDSRRQLANGAVAELDQVLAGVQAVKLVVGQVDAVAVE